jgi:flagellar protein FlgJ
MKIDAMTPQIQATFKDAMQKTDEVTGENFDAVLKSAQASGDTEKLREVADQLEAVFLNMLMKTMRDSIPETEGVFKKSEAEKMFQSMLDEEYSNSLAEAGGIGIGDMIFDQMEKYLYNDEDKNTSSFEMKG